MPPTVIGPPVSDRSFRYGDLEAAFAAAAYRIAVATHYPHYAAHPN